MVAFVGWYQKVVKGNRIGYKFNYPGLMSKGNDFVCSDAEIPLACGTILFQKIANLFKNLLHDCILSKVVGPSFELPLGLARNLVALGGK